MQLRPLLALLTLVCWINPAAAGIDDYERLLARYVTKSADGVNRVDYGRWKSAAQDKAGLEAFIASQQQERPSALSKPQQFAFWANLYNAVTLKVILDQYPVKSIRDIKSEGVWLDPKAFTGPWVARRVTIEGRQLSLDEIEHSILRPMFMDPRAHYSVNCASIGCPNLRPMAWRAETLEADLDAAARDYINNTRAVSIGPGGALSVSSIYTWFKADFGGTDDGVIAHLKKYADPSLAAGLKSAAKIAGDHYDWGINDAAANPAAPRP